MNTTELFLVAMLIIFTVPYLVWRLGRTEYIAPLVVVQIITGILLGPGVLGAAFPDYYAFVFNPQVITALNGVAWWAVMLFVFIAGIELDLRQAWTHRRESSITAGLALGMPLLLGCGAARVMMQTAGWVGPKALNWQFVLGVGKQVAFIGVFALATWGLRWLMPRLREADRWYVSLIWLAACGLGADWSGLHFMVGAFIAGAVLDAHWFDQEDMDKLRQHVLLIVMPVFFLSTGLRTDWQVGGAAVFVAAAWLLVAAVAGKLIGLHMAGRILRWQPGEASLIGWLLQTKALIMIIFANILLDKAIITSETFTALLLMAVASTMLTIPVVTPMLQRLGGVLGRVR